MAVTINGTTGITTPDLDSTADISANGIPFGAGNGNISSNVAAGGGALAANGSAVNNVAIGYQSGAVTTGSNNTFYGTQSGNANLGGDSNTFVGWRVGFNNTTGSYNTYIGPRTASASGARYMTTGSANTIVGGYDGNGAGLDLRTSSNNVVLSDGSGYWRQLTDSTNTTYRYGDSNAYSWSKSVTGVKTAGSSGTSNKLVQIGPTSALLIKIMAIQSGNEANSATLVGNIAVSYGSGGTVAGTTSTRIGNISAISVSYDNGGSPIYTINCTLSYSGAAPTIYYVIEGLSTYNFTPL